MDIKIAREVAARIWCDQEVSAIEMDVELAEEIAQLLASRLTKRAADGALPSYNCECGFIVAIGETECMRCHTPRR